MGTIRQTARAWQWFAVVLVALLLGLAPSAQASTQDIRVVAAGVDENSHTAAELALEYAKKRAVYVAARKLGVADASKRVATFSPDDYKLIIRGYTVAQTRREGEITYAEVNVTIVDEALMKALKLPPLEDGAAPTHVMRGIMVLPVYVGPKRAYLWEPDNLLRAPLAAEVRRQAHGGVLLPGGDYDDLRLIDYQNALTVKASEMGPMFTRYGADEIIIAVLTPGAVGTTDASSVLLRRLKPADTAETARNEVLTIPAESADETSPSRLTKSVNAIAAAVTQIAVSTSEVEQLAREKAKTIAVTFAYATPKDFAKMQEAVRTSPQVLQLEFPAITLSRVTGTIYLQGDAKALREGLVKQGVVVTDTADGWRLSTR